MLAPYFRGFSGSQYTTAECRALALSEEIETFFDPNMPGAPSTSYASASVVKVLDKIVNGVGISEWEWTGLMEKCQYCRNYYQSTILRTHILECVQ
jgi:hypothetical protein